MTRAPRVVAAVGLGILFGVVPALAANDPGLPRQWNMHLIGAESAWSVGTGQGITIAVVDSGVHLAHEDLSARLVPGRNFVTPNAQPQDDNGHGTHVAGIAMAIVNNGAGVVGVAPSARIMPIKVLNSEGEGSYANAAAGIRWAVDNGAHVVNLSLGSTVATLIGTPEVFVDAIKDASARVVLCVVAAGNDFVLSSDFGDEDAIVVSATTRDDSAASYSNGVGEAKWGLAAPGGAGTGEEDDDILSTYWPHTETDAFGKEREYGPYAIAAGTSMAAPHVAGAAAVLRSLGLTPSQTVDRLRTTAKDLGTGGRDGVYGDGRIDVAKAVAGLQPAGGGTTSTTVAGKTTTTGRRTAGTTAGTRGRSEGLVATRAAGDSQDATTTTSTAVGSPTVPGDEVVAEDEEATTPERTSDDGGGITVWPVALLALAVLGAAGAGLARARRV